MSSFRTVEGETRRRDEKQHIGRDEQKEIDPVRQTHLAKSKTEFVFFFKPAGEVWTDKLNPCGISFKDRESAYSFYYVSELSVTVVCRVNCKKAWISCFNLGRKQVESITVTDLLLHNKLVIKNMRRLRGLDGEDATLAAMIQLMAQRKVVWCKNTLIWAVSV